VKFDQLLHKSSGQMPVFRANLNEDSEFHAGFRSYNDALAFLEVLLRYSKFAGLTLTEINPDHGAQDGSTIQGFAQDLTRLLALLPS
jgi:hypothetical protein